MEYGYINVLVAGRHLPLSSDSWVQPSPSHVISLISISLFFFSLLLLAFPRGSFSSGVQNYCVCTSHLLVACIGKDNCTYKLLETLKVKRPLGKLGRLWRDNIKNGQRINRLEKCVIHLLEPEKGPVIGSPEQRNETSGSIHCEKCLG
jgi:hypothetical protein